MINSFKVSRICISSRTQILENDLVLAYNRLHDNDKNTLFASKQPNLSSYTKLRVNL